MKKEATASSFVDKPFTIDVDSKDVDHFIDIPESSSFSCMMKMFMSDPV